MWLYWYVPSLHFISYDLSLAQKKEMNALLRYCEQLPLYPALKTGDEVV